MSSVGGREEPEREKNGTNLRSLRRENGEDERDELARNCI